MPLDNRLSQWRPREDRIWIADDIPELEKAWAYMDAVMQAIYSCLHGPKAPPLSAHAFIQYASFELLSAMIQARLIRGTSTRDWEEYKHTYQQLQAEIEDEQRRIDNEISNLSGEVPDDADDPF